MKTISKQSGGKSHKCLICGLLVISITAIVIFIHKSSKTSRSPNHLINNMTSSNHTLLPTKPSVFVSLMEGIIRGEKDIINNKTVNVFLGVPYARADRFEPPQRLVTWDGELNATSQPPACPQPDLLPELSSFKFLPDFSSEDCLFLNIYAPEKNVTNNDKLHPIMIYLHHGGFSYGGIGSEELDARLFAAEKKVIVITMQYRLGALGFLPLDDGKSLGLQDIEAALKWIKENVIQFGGDESRTTIVAHGTSVLSVLALEKNFRPQQMILQGGLILTGRESLRDKFLNTSIAFIDKLDCGEEELVKCLKQKRTEELLEMQYAMWEDDSQLLGPTMELDIASFNGNNILLGIESEDDFILGIYAESDKFGCELVKLCDQLSAETSSLRVYKIEDLGSPQDEVVFAMGIPLLQKSDYDKDEKNFSKMLSQNWDSFIRKGKVIKSLKDKWLKYSVEDKKYYLLKPNKQTSK